MRIALTLALSTTALALQSPDPNSPRWKGVVAVTEFLDTQGNQPIEDFIDNKVSKKLVERMGRGQLRDALDLLRDSNRNASLEGARPRGEYAAQITLSNHHTIAFELEPEPPHRFLRIGSIGADGKDQPQPPGHPLEGAEFSNFEQLDRVLKAAAARDEFSGVVLVGKNDEPVFHRAYGYANKEQRIPNRLNTRFNIGSINKFFTKVAAIQLIEAGKLNPDDTIGKYLRGFPEGVADKVTVQHLMDHKSGWGHYWDNPTWQAKRSSLRTLDQYMDFIKDIPLTFEPGTRTLYSNTGYEVLGAVIEKVVGRSYYDHIRDAVYKPAGMTHTDANERDGNTPNMAVGYTGGGYAEDSGPMLAYKGTAAGGGFSTALDLFRFARAIDEGKLIPQQYVAKMRRMAFAGGGPGVNALLELSPAPDYTLAVVSNFDPPAASSLGRRIGDMLRRQAARDGTGRKYRLGVGLDITMDGVSVDFVEPGSPAQRDGLQPGDTIVAINDQVVGEDPIELLDPLLKKPDPIRFRLIRDGKTVTVPVTPARIGG